MLDLLKRLISDCNSVRGRENEREKEEQEEEMEMNNNKPNTISEIRGSSPRKYPYSQALFSEASK